jgi:hypothetical protein
LRLQKLKEVVEEKEAPIESVEDPIPAKTEEATHVWKPTGRIPPFTIQSILFRILPRFLSYVYVVRSQYHVFLEQFL